MPLIISRASLPSTGPMGGVPNGGEDDQRFSQERPSGVRRTCSPLPSVLLNGTEGSVGVVVERSGGMESKWLRWNCSQPCLFVFVPLPNPGAIVMVHF